MSSCASVRSYVVDLYTNEPWKKREERERERFKTTKSVFLRQQRNRKRDMNEKRTHPDLRSNSCRCIAHQTGLEGLRRRTQRMKKGAIRNPSFQLESKVVVQAIGKEPSLGRPRMCERVIEWEVEGCQAGLPSRVYGREKGKRVWQEVVMSMKLDLPKVSALAGGCALVKDQEEPGRNVVEGRENWAAGGKKKCERFASILQISSKCRRTPSCA